MADTLLGSVGETRLRDGRRLAFAAVGPTRGFPVLYMHGGIGSPRWRTPRLDALIRDRGIRYLVVNRPGFGGSDPHPGRTVADFAFDVEQVADAHGYERFSVIGVSAGAPYALACGWGLPERVTAVAVVSPLGPASGTGASASPRYLVPRLAFGVPAFGPALGGAILRLARMGGTTATRTMMEDYEVCRRPWGFDPAEVPGPVRLWHGRSDRLVPVAHALRLASALPACATHLEPGRGHFFLSRCLEDIIGPLAEPDAPAATGRAALQQVA
jgi:pimeloyl-ACP methyl ester carboxylesterase